jgi:hypothetical protein
VLLLYRIHFNFTHWLTVMWYCMYLWRKLDKEGNTEVHVNTSVIPLS